MYFGDQRNYHETDVDDNFLYDDSWDTTTHTTDFVPEEAIREVPADVEYAAKWSEQNKFRIDMLFNGGGSVPFAEEGQHGRRGGVGGANGETSTGRFKGDRPAAGGFQKDQETSAGSATPGTTRTSTSAARPRATSKPSSTRTRWAMGARNEAGRARADGEHRADGGAGQRQPVGDHHRRAFGLANLVPATRAWSTRPTRLSRSRHRSSGRQTGGRHLYLRGHR